MIWLNNRTTLDNFLQDLNQFHPTIKFTHEISTTTINYLDISVTLNQGNLSTKTYHKPTDANNYLHYQSCHPKHQKESIPYSQYLRMKRNSSTQQDAQKSIQQLSTSFKQRGYPTNTLEKSSMAVANITQEHLLTTNKPRKETSRKLIYITTFHPNGPNVKNLINKYSHILGQHPHTIHLQEESRYITAYRRPPNMKMNSIVFQII